MPQNEFDEWRCRELHARLDEIETLIGRNVDGAKLLWLLDMIHLEIVCCSEGLEPEDPRAMQLAGGRRNTGRGKCIAAKTLEFHLERISNRR